MIAVLGSSQEHLKERDKGETMAAESKVIEIETNHGLVRGLKSPGVSRFLGVPYARPPVGEFRFRAPQPPGSWLRSWNAMEYAKPASQNPDPLDDIWGQTLAPGDEDCLTVNIWTPAADGGHRPVMVCIHGGAFVIGSGMEGWYEGSKLRSAAT